MAYQIQYGQTAMHIKLEDDRKKKSSPWIKSLIPVLVVLFLAYLLNTDSVQEFLIPGDKEITKAAWSQMTQSLEDGEPLTEVFRTFCSEIVHKSDVS